MCALRLPHPCLVPTACPTPCLPPAVCRALREAAARGFACAVTGDGADELFGGYSFTHRQGGKEGGEEGPLEKAFRVGGHWVLHEGGRGGPGGGLLG